MRRLLTVLNAMVRDGHTWSTPLLAEGAKPLTRDTPAQSSCARSHAEVARLRAELVVRGQTTTVSWCRFIASWLTTTTGLVFVSPPWAWLEPLLGDRGAQHGPEQRLPSGDVERPPPASRRAA
jgi:hypothetical protein